ncbi:MAG: hypothetical protein CMP11_00120 [Zetaproteobacteria bacterium]|nr:hypothetical protein [Pseudobdellovibrionaceae bacterium]
MYRRKESSLCLALDLLNELEVYPSLPFFYFYMNITYLLYKTKSYIDAKVAFFLSEDLYRNSFSIGVCSYARL